jgi:hypothetical protein
MATKFLSAGSAVLGAGKSILPGLFVSIIGGSFAFLVFNNPKKIKGKGTRTAWESVRQYEHLFIDNTDIINCDNWFNRPDRYKNNLLHQIEMTSENLKNVLNKEEHVDNLMLAVINLKIDSYNEMKELTNRFMDSMSYLAYLAKDQAYVKEEIDARFQRVHGQYMDEVSFLRDRDTMTIRKVLAELSNTYDIKYTEEDNFLDTSALSEKITGKWALVLYPVQVQIGPGKTGFWIREGTAYPFKWEQDKEVLHFRFIKDADPSKNRMSDFDIKVKRITDKIFTFNISSYQETSTFTGCKMN